MKPLYHRSNRNVSVTERKPYAVAATRIVISLGLTSSPATVTSTGSLSQVRVRVAKDVG